MAVITVRNDLKGKFRVVTTDSTVKYKSGDQEIEIIPGYTIFEAVAHLEKDGHTVIIDKVEVVAPAKVAATQKKQANPNIRFCESR